MTHTYQTNMPINRLDPTIGVRYKEFGVNELLDGKYDAILAFQPNGSPNEMGYSRDRTGIRCNRRTLSSPLLCQHILPRSH